MRASSRVWLVSASLACVALVSLASLHPAGVSAQPSMGWDEFVESLIGTGKVDASLARAVAALYDGGEPDTYVPVIIILHGPPEIWEDALLTELPDARVVRAYPSIPAIYAWIRASEVASLSEKCWVAKMMFNVISVEPYVEFSEIADKAMALESCRETVEASEEQVEHYRKYAEACKRHLNDAMDVVEKYEKLTDSLLGNLTEKNAQIRKLRWEKSVLGFIALGSLSFAAVVGMYAWRARTEARRT